MDRLIDKLVKLPKWNALIVLVIYALLTGELSSTILTFSLPMQIPEESMGVITVVLLVGCLIGAVLSWVLMAALVFVAAVIFSGKGKFKDLLFCSTYFYIIPILAMPFAIYFMSDVYVPKGANVLEFLQTNENFRIASLINNFASVPVYVMFIFAVRRIFGLNNWKSIVCAVIPAALLVALPLILQAVQ